MAATMTRQEACRVLQVGPKMFRRLCEEFAQEIPIAPGQGVSMIAMERIRLILRLREEGVATQEIRTRLEVNQGSMEVAASQSAPQHVLVSEISNLSAALHRSEKIRLEERDKILTALMRTQQEISSLRHELTVNRESTGSRQDRKKGILTRWF